MFYATQINDVCPAEPARFDPLTGPAASIRRVTSSDVRPEETIPVFIDIGGDRSSLTGWRSALRFALGIANRRVPNPAALSALSGLEIRPGRGHPNMNYHPDLDASIPPLSTGRNAQTLFRLLDGLGQPARLRVRTGSQELLVEHRPARRPRPAPPPQTVDTLIRSAQRGEVALGSIVEISVEGQFEHRAFRIAGAGADPRQGGLSVISPIGRALIGLRPGSETSYEVGPSSRRVSLHRVDNERLIRTLTTTDPAPWSYCE